jgi:hypothetical protein
MVSSKNTCPSAGVFYASMLGLLLTAGVILPATRATNGFLLGNAAFFGFRDKPSLTADIAEDSRAGDCLPKTSEQLLLRFILS